MSEPPRCLAFRIEGSWEEMMSSQAEFWGTTREKDVSQWTLGRTHVFRG